jgi:hypothetical protein
MRNDADIVAFIEQARREREILREHARRLQEEDVARKRVFYQAARGVFTHVIEPQMERFRRVCLDAQLRPQVGDTGAFYLPGAIDVTLVAKFQIPIGKADPELPICVSFKAVYPVGMAVYFTDADRSQDEAKGPVEEVDLADITPDFVEDRLMKVIVNYLHEI